MAVKLHSAQTVGLDASIIDVELDISQGMPSFTIVGLADKAVDEAKHRISYAVGNIGYKPPHKRNQKVVSSLAPANLKKEGPSFDVALALAYLLASKQISFESAGKLFLGELALDGTLRPIDGVLSLARAAKENGFREVFVPKGNGKEAALIRGISVYEAKTLLDIVEHLSGSVAIPALPPTNIQDASASLDIDMRDIRGHASAKEALIVAASGGHNIAFSGPPGTGKTLLARALPGILPPLSFEEALEVTAIHSIAGVLDRPVITKRPFRAPHHTSSYVALVGGGTMPRPGEITLAHRGVLFCDEFPEFERRIIEALRQPLEDGFITIARSRAVFKYPARFMLVCAMNPCPCGYFGSKKRECRCSPASLHSYQRKISGPVADRIDLWSEVHTIDYELLGKQEANGTPSSDLRKNVVLARERQKERFSGTSLRTNSEMGTKDIEKFVSLTKSAQSILLQAAKRLGISARSYHRMIKIARTIADIDGSDTVSQTHIEQALQYRPEEK